MNLEDIIRRIDNVSKEEIKRVAPKDCGQIKEIIMNSNPTGLYEKMVVGYLTSLCAEYMYPDTFHLERDGLDYIGFELERGIIEVGAAGSYLGSCMRNGKIATRKAGEETGSSMLGGEITVDEIKGIGNTLGGKISAKKVGSIAKSRGADVYINGVKFKRGLLDRLLGR